MDLIEKSEDATAIAMDAQDILLDIKFMIKDKYFATFTPDGNSLKINLNNGQTFLINAVQFSK